AGLGRPASRAHGRDRFTVRTHRRRSGTHRAPGRAGVLPAAAGRSRGPDRAGRAGCRCRPARQRRLGRPCGLRRRAPGGLERADRLAERTRHRARVPAAVAGDRWCRDPARVGAAPSAPPSRRAGGLRHLAIVLLPTYACGMSIRSESEFWILSSLAEGRRHGYGIMQDVAASSEGRTRLKAPTLYAALERLENDGCIRPGGEEIVDGRARRYY